MFGDPLSRLAALNEDQWNPFLSTALQRVSTKQRLQDMGDSSSGLDLTSYQRGQSAWATDALQRRLQQADARSVLDQMIGMTGNGVGSGSSYAAGLQKYLQNPEGEVPGLNDNFAKQFYDGLGITQDDSGYHEKNVGLDAVLSSAAGRSAIGDLMIANATKKYGGAAGLGMQARVADASARSQQDQNPYAWLKNLSELGGQFGTSPAAAANPVPQLGSQPGQYGGITVTDADFQQPRYPNASGVPVY